jgi:response regulator RpfG family c-di-GMP phosphodiesterase
MTVYVGPDVARLQREMMRHDPLSASHMQRVSQYAGLIASGLGMEPRAVEHVIAACSLHDIGKLSIPQRLLGKRRALSPAEQAGMREHVRFGYALLLDAGFPLAGAAAKVALHHHEKFDGSGYPDGLAGQDIPLEARIASLADVFDALTSRRPQRCALGIDFALEYIRRQGGLHFDPDCVAAFLAEEPRLPDVRRRFPDPSEELEEREAGYAEV